VNLRTVHIVDDEEAVLQSMACLLEAAGYVVKLYASGVELLDGIATAEPGCIILDVDMPVIDGLGTQRILNERGVRMPVIFLTGHGDATMKTIAIQAGAIDFIYKPVSQTILLHAITTAFAGLDFQLRDRA
jgi:two-component system response regulator FixJ